MKSIFQGVLLYSGLALAQAQEGYHEHDGFFLSMNIGPAFGPVLLEASGTSFRKLEVSGTGGTLDFKIGGTIKKTLTLSFDIVTRGISGPDMEVDGQVSSASNSLNASDGLVGLGVTYYIMPVNILLSSTVGMASFTLKDDNSPLDARSESGFGLQMKAGKEWWVGKNWGLGISGGLGLLRADDKKDPNNPGYKGELSTKKFFVMFNTTYN